MAKPVTVRQFKLTFSVEDGCDLVVSGECVSRCGLGYSHSVFEDIFILRDEPNTISVGQSAFSQLTGKELNALQAALELLRRLGS
jgi:transketolase C-terminal domain/subunit